MKPGHRRLVLMIAVPGVAACVVALSRFLVVMWRNGLPWNHGQFAEEHYRAVGQAYGQAFAVGFFLCLFMVTTALALSRRS